MTYDYAKCLVVISEVNKMKFTHNVECDAAFDIGWNHVESIVSHFACLWGGGGSVCAGRHSGPTSRMGIYERMV